jgi:hypothetical protein
MSLGFKPKALAGLLKSSLHLPAHHKPGDDALGIGVGIGAQQSLGLKPLLRVADQHPTQWHGG